MGFLKVILVSSVLLGALTLYLCPCFLKESKVPKMPDHKWWGKGPEPRDASTFKIVSSPFKVSVQDSVLQDLKKRLDNSRLTDPLEDVEFQYGFNTDYLKTVLQYWKTKYDWRKQEALLNQYPQFLAKIEGIDVHYIHVKPVGLDETVRVFPLLMVHGWPGSVVEFYKIIPMLSKSNKGIAFEIICPSIPGYGFSEAPHHPGFAAADAARVFSKLMTSLGHQNFYFQGGDWGALIGNTLSLLYPERVTGLHLNMAAARNGIVPLLKYIVGSYVPSIFSGNHKFNIFPFKEFFSNMILEMGYMHLQATKPDTAGVGLNDSPAGLAAYILEKFSSWTSMDNRDKKDGGLLTKFTMDELLTNVMVYWVTDSITSSMRFYKENMKQDYMAFDFDGLPVHVPTGVGIGPNELIVAPQELLTNKFPQLVSYTHLERGGHFLAFEEPKLLADDLVAFVGKVEDLSKSKVSKPVKTKPEAEAKQPQVKKSSKQETKPVEIPEQKPTVTPTKAPEVKVSKASQETPAESKSKVTPSNEQKEKDSKTTRDKKPSETNKAKTQETGKQEL